MRVARAATAAVRCRSPPRELAGQPEKQRNGEERVQKREERDEKVEKEVVVEHAVGLNWLLSTPLSMLATVHGHTSLVLAVVQAGDPPGRLGGGQLGASQQDIALFASWQPNSSRARGNVQGRGPRA